MKKYVTAILTSMIIIGIITGCGHKADIGKDKAAQIALDDANLSESDVTRLHVSKDRDDGETIYEIKFTNENTEYEYEILASNGNILSADYEGAYPSSQPDQDTQNAQNNSQSQDTQNNSQGQDTQANAQITIEEASKLALDKVPGASAQDLKIELDHDDGQYKYEGNIIFEQKEYEFEIDANTGEFLEWKEERR